MRSCLSKFRTHEDVRHDGITLGGIAVGYYDVERRVKDVSTTSLFQRLVLALEQGDGTLIRLVASLDAVRFVALGIYGFLLLLGIVLYGTEASDMAASQNHGDVCPFIFS